MNLYKVTDDRGRSMHGGSGQWRKNRWRSVSDELKPCVSGLHLCREQDLVHWLGPVIWDAEVHPDAVVIEAADKVVASRARVIRRLDTWNDRTSRLFAADCAERVVHLCGNDPRPREAIEAARRYANGEATDDELVAAWVAAWAAARAPARAAARAPARAAAREAARAAARAAAWAAAREAAWEAAREAAREAAWEAARAAAWEAARAPARAAARAAEHRWQTARLMEYLRGER